MDDGVQHPPAAVRVAEQQPRLSWGEFALSLVLLALGVVVILDGLDQPESTSASGIGAGMFPVIIGGLLVVVSSLLAVQVLRRRHGDPEDVEGDVDVAVLRRGPVAIVAASIVFFIVTLDLLGYILAAAITFWLIAFAIGARHHVRSAIIAVVLSTVVYFLFTLVLQIELPAGVFEGVL